MSGIDIAQMRRRLREDMPAQKPEKSASRSVLQSAKQRLQALEIEAERERVQTVAASAMPQGVSSAENPSEPRLYEGMGKRGLFQTRQKNHLRSLLFILGMVLMAVVLQSSINATIANPRLALQRAHPAFAERFDRFENPDRAFDPMQTAVARGHQPEDINYLMAYGQTKAEYEADIEIRKTLQLMGWGQYLRLWLGEIIEYPVLHRPGTWSIGALVVVLGFFSLIRIVLFGYLQQGLQKPPTHHHRRVVPIMASLCAANGLEQPELLYLASEDINAFVHDTGRGKAKLVVTEGLMKAMNDAELRAVLAKQLAHIAVADTTLSIVSASMVNTFADTGFWFFRKIRREPLQVIVPFLMLLFATRFHSSMVSAIIFSPILAFTAAIGALMLQRHIMRKRDFVADSIALDFTKAPAPLCSALEKARRAAHPTVQPASGALPFVPYWDTRPVISARLQTLYETTHVTPRAVEIAASATPAVSSSNAATVLFGPASKRAEPLFSRNELDRLQNEPDERPSEIEQRLSIDSDAFETRLHGNDPISRFMRPLLGVGNVGLRWINRLYFAWILFALLMAQLVFSVVR